MKHKLTTLLALSVITLCANPCFAESEQQISQSTAKQVKLGEMPDWVNENPTNDDYFYASASDTSLDLQMATDKAATIARAEIAQMIEAHIKNEQKSFAEEISDATEAKLEKFFSRTTSVIASQALIGSRIDKKHIVREGNNFRAYVLVKYPIGKVNADLSRQIKAQKYANTQLRATEAFKELEENVAKYDAAKKQQ